MKSMLAMALLALTAAVDADLAWQSLDASLSQRVKAREPGFAVLVLDDGKRAFSGSYGLADLEDEQPITSRTPFYVASLGKAVTAVAVLQLAQRGKLQLDQPISDHVTGLPEWLTGARIDQALTHTAGIPDHPDDLAGDHHCLGNDDVLDWLGQQAHERIVGGEATAYSNAAYVLLAEVAAAAAGMSFRDYVHANIFEPAGMATARVIESSDDRPTRRAVGYVAVDGQWEPADYTRCTTGPGGIYASADDLAAFDAALRDGRLLGEAAMQQLYTPATLADGSLTPYSPGWISGEINGGELAGLQVRQAFGGLAGFRAAIRQFVAPPVTVIWLSNRGEGLFDAGIESAVVQAGVLPAAASGDE